MITRSEKIEQAILELDERIKEIEERQQYMIDTAKQCLEGIAALREIQKSNYKILSSLKPERIE